MPKCKTCGRHTNTAVGLKRHITMMHGKGKGKKSSPAKSGTKRPRPHPRSHQASKINFDGFASLATSRREPTVDDVVTALLAAQTKHDAAKKLHSMSKSKRPRRK